MKCLLCNKRIWFWQRKKMDLDLHDKCYEEFASKVFNEVLEGVQKAFRNVAKSIGKAFLASDELRELIDEEFKKEKENV